MVWSFTINQLRKSSMTSQPEQPTNNQQPNSEQDSHYMRVLLAIVVPVVVFVIAWPVLWNLSQQSDSGQDASAIHYMLSVDELAAFAADAGYAATGDDVTSVLLEVSPKGESKLSQVALITVDDTQSSAKLLEINPDVPVACDNLTESLNDTYTSSGSEGVAYVVAHAGLISVDHIVEMDEDSWQIIESAVKQGSESLSVDIAKLLEGIIENDMSVRTIREVLSRATSYGFSAESIVQVSDPAQIGLLAGTITQAS